MSTKLESHGRGNILVLNAGSSSLKFASFHVASGQSPTRTLHGTVDGIGTAPKLQAWAHEGGPVEEVALSPNPTSSQSPPCITDPAQGQQAALAALLSWLKAHPTQGPLLAGAHRVVHGGESFTQPTWVTPNALQQLDALVPLAPLHQPHNLAAIRALANLQPALPQLACFDTAFHAHQSWVAQAYALPRHISQKGVKRYGFHGVSYEYIARVLPQHLGEAAQGRVVVAHLGNGASLCAMKGLRSVASTMGLTALDGLMMGTRCGQIDPGVLLYLMQHEGMSTAQLETLLYKESGLLGVSGLSSDMRALEASQAPDAQAAIELYVRCITREIGAMAAVLGGLDALVFTAGVGEHSAMVRERVCKEAQWLGLSFAPDANAAHQACISASDSKVSAWVIPTNEEWMIAQHAQEMLLSPA
jgi:acetate kinase